MIFAVGVQSETELYDAKTGVDNAQIMRLLEDECFRDR
jgi:hypothetical protein